MLDDITLKTFLRPLQPWLDDPDAKDIHIRKPGVVFVKTVRGKERHEVPELTFEHLLSIAQIAANLEDKQINEQSPWLDCSFPGGARVHVKIPPFCPQRTVSVAIRLPRAQNWALDEIERRGTFTNTALIRREDDALPADPSIDAASERGDVAGLLKALVLSGRTIGVTGQVGSGKTTLMNGLLKVVPLDECVITIQDVPEVDLPHEDWSQSLVSFTSAAVTSIDPSKALRSALRDDGDRLFVGELRGAEAYMWLQAINTGYSGSIASWHANEGLEAGCQRLADMVSDAIPQSDNARVYEQARRYVDCIVHMKRSRNGMTYGCSQVVYR